MGVSMAIVPGGGTASLKVGTHCQSTVPAFWRGLPLSSFYRPLFFRVLDHRPPNLSTKVIQGLLHSFLYKECHVFHKIEEKQTYFIS